MKWPKRETERVDAPTEPNDVSAAPSVRLFDELELRLGDERMPRFESARARSPRYQDTRDQPVFPIFDFTTQLATLAPPPPEMQQPLGAVHGNTDAMSDFVSVAAGTLAPADFFDPANIGQSFAAAGAAVG